MSDIEIPASIREFIFERIANFEQEAAPQELWESANVREHQGLPLFRGWTETLAIRPDGTLIKWSTEEWSGAREFQDRTWMKVALTQGAKKYPELAPLIPARPSSATTCSQCAGSGDPFRENEKLSGTIVCSCGGVGWLEATDNP